MASWDFPVTRGAGSGFSDGAIDTFAGDRLSSMVREIIQNSLDAVKDPTMPITVHFSLEEYDRSDLSDLDSLTSHFKQCLKEAKDQEVDKAIDFFEAGLKELSSDKKIKVLVISDSNTKGLSGSIHERKGPWYALVMSNGLSQKSGLGSFGHGSKAPFNMTSIRSLYYLTRTEVNDVVESRFQGKSILQSHPHPRQTGETAEAVGFYSKKSDQDRPIPLLNDEIPQWASETRNKHSEDTGTTLFIPFTSFDKGLFPETKITVLANFYYAIREGNLNVVVDGDEINRSNVDEYFRWGQQNLPYEHDLIDRDYVEESFKGVEGIINSTADNEEEIEGFGKIKWHIRVDADVLKKRVSIARKPGMLITRKPKGLLRFAGCKNFEMFVYVEEGDGYKALTKLENPKHDDFSYDRIQGQKDEKKIRKLYEQLTDHVRKIIKEHAGIEAGEEVTVTDLQNLMFDLDQGENNEKNKERSNVIQISEVSSQPKIKPKGTAGASGTRKSKGGNKGKKKGKGGGSNPTGRNPGDGDKSVTVPSGTRGISKGIAKMPADNLRIVHRDKASNSAKIFFDAFKEGRYSLSLLKVGETDQQAKENVLFLKDGKEESAIALEITESGRQSLTITLSDKEDYGYAIEGWLDEVQ